MSAEGTFVDVTYRGIAVAHKAKFAAAGEGGFVESEAPLPVGARVVVTLDTEPKEATVIGVVEQEAGAKSAPGMRVRWGFEPEPPPVAIVTEEVGAHDTTVMQAVTPEQIAALMAGGEAASVVAQDASTESEPVAAAVAHEATGPTAPVTADAAAAAEKKGKKGKKKR